MQNEKRFGMKTLVMACAASVAAFGVVGGTIAWLISQDKVTNTFTYGDINVTLEETDTGIDNDGDAGTNEYEMVPGNTIAKDPTITVEADSEDCWLFAKLEKSDNFDTFMSYEIADGWAPLDGVTDVYYRIAKNSADDQSFAVLKDNAVTVKGAEVTKEMLNALDADGAKNYPTLTVYAYGVQYDLDIDAIDTAAEAWALTQE